MNDQAKPFVTAKNAMGITQITDIRKKDGKNKGVIAIFFQDQQYPARAELYANVCAEALNEEAARRAQK